MTENNEKTSDFDLNKHIFSLLQDEPFFAALSRTIDKMATFAVPTAGVGINKNTGYFELYYNPAFFEALPADQRKGVLKHEFYHLVFEHVTGRLPASGLNQQWNVATDLAINSHLAGQLPKECCMPGEGIFSEQPAYKTAEWYFDSLDRDEKYQEATESMPRGEGQPEEGEGGEGQEGEGDGQPQGGSGTGQFDNHDSWGEVDTQTKDIAKERLKEAVKKAAKECDEGRGWGTVSQGVKQEIRERLVTQPLDWKKVLRYFVKTSVRADKKSTIKKINRRYPYIHPGRKTNRRAKIAISIDQSGSVSDKMLEGFFAELNELAKLAEFTVVPFDHQVFEEKVFVWKKGQTNKKERVLCGGTCFNAPTKYVNDHKFDGHIILTDMYAPKPIASKCQRMWMTDRDGASHPYFKTNEKIIVINT